MDDEDLEVRLTRIEKLTLLAAKNVLNVDDVALLTGKSSKTIRNNIKTIPHYRNRFGTWFKRDDIERWLIRND